MESDDFAESIINDKTLDEDIESEEENFEDDRTEENEYEEDEDQEYENENIDEDTEVFEEDKYSQEQIKGRHGPGSRLEKDINTIFSSIKFITERNKIFKDSDGKFEVDVLASKDDIKVLVEAKEYENSFFPKADKYFEKAKRNGKSLGVDRVLFVISGKYNDKKELKEKAENEYGIYFWNEKILDNLLSMDIRERNREVLKLLNLEKTFKDFHQLKRKIENTEGISIQSKNRLIQDLTPSTTLEELEEDIISEKEKFRIQKFNTEKRLTEIESEKNKPNRKTLFLEELFEKDLYPELKSKVLIKLIDIKANLDEKLNIEAKKQKELAMNETKELIKQVESLDYDKVELDEILTDISKINLDDEFQRKINLSKIKIRINQIVTRKHIRDLNRKDIEERIQKFIDKPIEPSQKIHFIKKIISDQDLAEIDKRLLKSIILDIETDFIIEKELVRNMLNSLLEDINRNELQIIDREKLRQELFNRFKFNPNKEDFSESDFTFSEIHIVKTDIDNFKLIIDETVKNNIRSIRIKQISLFLIISTIIIGVTVILNWLIF